MKAKKLVIVAAVVVSVLIGALAAIPFFIDAQSLKTKLVTEAEVILHRRMSVQAVEITVFTGLGIRLNRAIIFDDLRFANAPFVSLNSVTVRPRLLPLLRGSVEVASIELEQPEIRLIQNQNRIWNFESIGAAPVGRAGKPGPAGAPPASSPGKSSQSFAVSQLNLSDGAVVISKRSSSGALEESRYDHINLNLRNFSTDQAGSFDLNLQLPPGAHALQLKGRLGPVQLSPFSKTPVDGEIQFSELPMARLASLASPPAKPVEWQGFLSTVTRLKGSLDQGFLLEGKTAYSKLGAKRGALQSPQVDGEVHLKADYKAQSGTLQLQQAELRMPASTLTMSGSIAGLDADPALDLRINSHRLAFDDLIKLAAVLGQGAPDGVQASGNGQLNLQVSGSSKKPQVAGEAKLADVWIRYPGLTDKITLSPVVLAFKDNTVASNEIQISAGERTRLQAQWKAALGDPVSVDAQVRSAKPVPVSDLLAIASSFGITLPEGMKVQDGSIDLQLTARQTLGEKPVLSLQGQAALSGSKVQTALLKAPMEVHQVQLQFTGQSASIPSLSASFAGSKLGGKLLINNFEYPTLQFALNADRLDLSKLERMINTAESAAPKSSGAPAAKVPEGGSQTAKSKPAPASQDPLGRLTVRDSSVAVDAVSYDTLRLTNVSSKIQMKNRVLQLQDLKFNMNQGTHVGTASFDLNGAQPRYTFSSLLRDVDANEFLTQNTSLKNLLYGKLSSDINLQGSGSGFDEISKQLKGGGKVTVAKGKITSFNLSEQVALLGRLAGLNVGQGGTEFEDLVSELSIADGRVTTNAMHFRASGMALKVRGSLGLDRSADYQISAELPAAISKKNPNQFLNLANATFFQNESGNAVIPLRMTGDIARPKLSLDTQMVKENLKNSLRQGGVTKALDTFQGLLKSKDQKAAAQPSPDAPANSAQPTGEKAAEPKPAAKPGLEGLFQGIMDQVKEKKKEPKQEKKE
ncbi:MAG TPA: AsmA family protein [Terriglobia bacterium]|nr:AsmA family protein [Terriglobia bacterium]